MRGPVATALAGVALVVGMGLGASYQPPAPPPVPPNIEGHTHPDQVMHRKCRGCGMDLLNLMRAAIAPRTSKS